ncbi:MAG: glycerol-3-phosphate acyltransferase [Acidimicrobiia bacterium]|nr:glycerol-3-phosphate acyltransferase [Acidimicrobiia bacterium]
MSETVVGVALMVAAYFAGSFPTASAVGMLSGHDHSKEGSGNPGASNVYRTSGAAYGIVTVVVDVMKGFIPVLAALVVLDRPWAAAVWAAATIGHVIPFARWRNGGKGVATGGGGSLPLYPYLGLLLVVVFIAVVKLTRRASVGSLAITGLLVGGVVVLHEHPIEIAASVVVAGLVVYRHRSNIGRLISGEELPVR